MSALTSREFLDHPTITHDAFLREKVAFDRSFGFPVNDKDLHPILLPHQRDIVRWAILGGRRAIFAKFGLGKSVMQLEVLRQVLTHPASTVPDGRALIIAPLGVRGEFIRNGRELLGIEVRFIRRTEEIDPAWSGIYVTNYESVRDGRLSVDGFDAVSLDEASVLRSFGSKTYQEFLGLFDSIPYRFVATATPSPNRHKEPVRTHLRDLKAAGMTGERIAEAAGVPHSTVKTVLHSRGAGRGPVESLLADRAAALLNVAIPEVSR